MPTNPPANPLPGAVYIDQSTNISWVWTGTYWLQAYGGSQNYNAQTQPTTAILPGYFAEPSPDSWFPHVGATAPLNPGCGQIWVDNSVSPNYAQVWDCNTSTWIQLGGIPGGDTNSITSATPPSFRVNGDLLVDGDLWLNTTDNTLSYRYGGAWIQSTAFNNNSIYSTFEPATRVDGSSLIAGDLWLNPTEGTIYYHNGGITNPFVPIKAADPDHQASATEPTTRPDGLPLLPNDLWTDTVNNRLYYRIGTGAAGSWVRYNDTHSVEKTSKPTAADYDNNIIQGGDMWYEPTTDALHVYDSSLADFVRVNYNDLHSFWVAGAPPASRQDGTPPIDGDMWVDGTPDIYGRHIVKVRSGVNWVAIDRDTHAFTGSGDPNGVFNVRPDNTATHPSPLLKGDIYIDTVTNRSYWYDTTFPASWKLFGKDTHSEVQAGTPFRTTGTLPKTTRTDGTALVEGDQVIDSNTNILYAYVAGATNDWVAVSGDTHAFTGAGTPFITGGTASKTTRDDSSALLNGDLFVDTITNQIYWFNTALLPAPGEWVELGSAAATMVGAGNPLPAEINQVAREDGTALQTGDVFIDSTRNEGWYNITTAGPVNTWYKFAFDRNSRTGAGIPSKLGGAGLVTVATREDGSQLVDGDQYLDTNTNTLYTFIAAPNDDWVETSRDTNSVVFTGPTEPVNHTNGSPFKDGDQWVDNSYTPAIEYTWFGGSFLPHGDVSVVAALPATGAYTNQLLVNSTNNRLYRWDESLGAGNEFWVQVV